MDRAGSGEVKRCEGPRCVKGRCEGTWRQRGEAAARRRWRQSLRRRSSSSRDKPNTSQRTRTLNQQEQYVLAHKKTQSRTSKTMWFHRAVLTV